ncbi:VOC family protein [Rhizobium puerariae]|uniref:VOC family protein n=1 Tax=Rhizobium puerariae TaxID=1585791 RepID=A0ABV6ALQ6_9HYPH
MIGSDFSLSLSLFVKQGLERETADFYRAAFGAEEINCYEMLRLLMIEMRLGPMGITVCGSDPKREAAPSHEGPFHPGTAGAVSAIFQLTVPDVKAVVSAAVEAGGIVRDEVQTDTRERQVASVFDPAGHIWVLIEQGQGEEEPVS